MVYRVYDGGDLVQITPSPIIAYAIAETLKKPRVEDDRGLNALHPSHREE